MPSLNYDILEEIFLESIKVDTTQNLEKFMLSGKNPFNIVLRFFSKTQHIDLEPDYFGLWVKEENYQILHNFAFLKPLLEVIPQTIVQLNIGENADICRGTKFFESFIRKDMKALVLDEKLPQDYDEIIHAKTSVEEVIFQYDAKYEDLLIVPFSCKKFTVYMNFEEMTKKRTKSIVLPSVETLIIINEFIFDELPSEKMELFVKFILETFPNLKSFNTHFSCSEICIFETIFKMEIGLDTSMYALIPKHVKGIIRFCVRFPKFQQMFVQNGQIDETENAYLGPCFPLHNGLNLQYFFKFNADIDEEDDAGSFDID
uniref:DUF38 domain-containing protein n=1 Tax=Panagrolaimus davidi TaxID=227884 RepID=A0A914QGK2_9BILA